MSEEHKFDCSDLERALQEESPELIAELETHARSCGACREELRIWREISVAAQAMHKDWPTPALWPRIAKSLKEEAARPQGWRAWISGHRFVPAMRWQVAVATLALVIASVSGGWLLLHKLEPKPVVDDSRLLTDKAVRQVEEAEQNYEKSIEQLAKLAEPKLAAASTTLLVNYREKLELLDTAIADCRANLDKNRANAYLRAELLTFYQDKQRTLEEVLREN